MVKGYQMARIERDWPIFIPEREREEQIPWLAGVLEVGGSWNFYIRKESYPYPRITYAAIQKGEVDYLHSLFGGRTRPLEHSKCRWHEWSIRSDAAVELAERLRPYLSFRQEHIAAFRNWEEAGSLEERLEIARDLCQFNKKPVYSDGYRLPTNPRILAGIFDSRGLFTFQETKAAGGAYTVYPVVQINVPQSMGEALEERFGGSFFGSFWRVQRAKRGKEELVNFLGTIQPYVVFKKERVDQLLHPFSKCA